MRCVSSVVRFARCLGFRTFSFGLIAAIYSSLAVTIAGCDPCASCTSTTPPTPGAAHFTFTGPMTDSRIFHTANLLNTGQVLVAGGSQIPGTLDTAEMYDPTSATFTATAGAMTQARHHHTATLLNDGTVLVAGGDNGGGLLLATAFLSAELYDPTTGKFSATGSMFSPRTWQTATLLTDGKVLMAGGSPAVDSTINPDTGNGTGLPVGALPNAELYYPANKEFVGNPGAMNDARTEHASALIKGCSCTVEGQVLVTGGVDATGATLSSAELFNESAGSFTLTGRMNVARHNHTATTLQDGRVLVAGGVNNSFLFLDSAEIYDPTTGVFTPTATPMTKRRAFHSAQLLNDGRVLIAGGSGDLSAEIFDPSTNAFTATAGPMEAERFEMPAALLPDGDVLIPGGGLLYNAVGELLPNSSLDTAEVFSASAGTFSYTAQTMVRPRVGHTGTMLNSGKVLITGGADLTVQIFDTSELYDPSQGTFSCIGGTPGRECAASMHQKRFSQTATLINSSSQVLIAGGSDGSTVGTPAVLAGIATAEIYDASSKTYSCVGGVSSTPPVCNNSMVDGRYNHLAVALADGEVLLAGGIDSTGTVTNSAELFNPATGKFTSTGSMNTPRQEFAGALFTSGPLSGQVLISGGADNKGNFLSSAELYNPATGKFTLTGSMSESRFDQVEILLGSGPNAGDILVVAGSGDQSTDIYDPAAQTFSTGGAMTQIIFLPVVNTLSSGQILLAGGSTFNSLGQIVPISGAELYDPTSGKFSATDSMGVERLFAAGAFLDPAVVSGTEQGDVLIAGGESINSTLSSAELFVPATSTTSSSASAASIASVVDGLSPAQRQQIMADTVSSLQHQIGLRTATGRSAITGN